MLQSFSASILLEWTALHKWRAYGLVALFLCAVLLYVEALPRVQDIVTDIQELASKREQIEAFANGGLNMLPLDNKEAMLENELDALQIDIPSEFEMSLIIERLERSKKGLDVTLNRIEPLPPRNRERYEEMPFTLIAEGFFTDLGLLIDRIETAPMSINSAEISRPANLSDPLVAKLAISSLKLKR